MRSPVLCMLAISVVACGSAEADKTGGGENLLQVEVAEFSSGPSLEVDEPTPVAQSSAACPKDEALGGIAGVRLEMTKEQAIRAAGCANPQIASHLLAYRNNWFDVELHPSGELPISDIQNEDRGWSTPDAIHIQLAGRIGEERVVAVGRMLRFDEGTAPTAENMREAIQNNLRLQEVSSSDRGWHAYDGTRVESSCVPVNGPRALSHLGLDCPRTTAVRMTYFRNNPQLVKEVRFMMSDGKLARKLVEEYNMEARRAQADKDQRDVEDASKRTVPNL